MKTAVKDVMTTRVVWVKGRDVPGDGRCPREKPLPSSEADLTRGEG